MPYRIRRYLPHALLLLALVAGGPCRADPLKLVAFQYPPLVYGEDGEVKGTATRLVRALFDELGVEVEIELLPWARALQYLELGQADGVFTIFRNPRREAFLAYPETPLIEQTIGLYRRRDRPIPFDGDLAGLAPYRIGVTRAVSYGRRFDAALDSTLPGVTRVNDEASKFQLLARGRVDLVVSSTGIADFYLGRLGLADRIVRIPTVIESVPSYLAFANASPRRALLPAFERTLRAFKASGRYRQIVEAAPGP